MEKMKVLLAPEEGSTEVVRFSEEHAMKRVSHN